MIVEGAAVHRVTIPFLDTLEGLHADLEQEDIRLLLCALPPDVVAHARRSRWFAGFDDAGSVFPTVDAAVASSRLSE